MPTGGLRRLSPTHPLFLSLNSTCTVGFRIFTSSLPGEESLGIDSPGEDRVGLLGQQKHGVIDQGPDGLNPNSLSI